MVISLENVLSRELKPLCSRDNHEMKYERGGSRANSGHLASCHCGSGECSVRFNSAAGYYMLFGMPGHAYAVDEPSVNTMKCTIHGAGCIAERILARNRVLAGFVASKIAIMATSPRQSRSGSGLREDSCP